VSTSGPDAVTAIVSSKWAEMLPSAVTTVHPSSILRERDDEARHREHDSFVSDLRKMARALSS